MSLREIRAVGFRSLGVVLMRRMLAVAVVMTGVAGCRTRPVSVVVPEVEVESPDLSAISMTGDTSWRTSAVIDLREHAHGVQAAPIPAPRIPAAAAGVPTVAKHSADPVGFAAITPQTVNADPTDDL